MHSVIKEIGGIIAAFVAWWAIAVLLGLMMYAIWPANGDHVAGVSLEPQNVPGNVLGFVLALYAFRTVTRRTSKETVAASADNVTNAA